MREIKFRAWNTTLHEMEYIDDLYWFEENQCHENGDNDYILMQHTGLKDSEGNEIYEGDIVKGAWSDDVRPMIVIYQPPEFVMKVSLKSKRWSQFIIHYKDNQLYKVIGNLYQNPELLNEPQNENI